MLKIVAGFLFVGGVLLLLLGVMVPVKATVDWRLLWAVYRAKRKIRQIVRQRCPDAKVLSKQGATRIDPRHLAIWIATRTDNERDLMRHEAKLDQQVRDALLRVGYPAKAVPLVRFMIESQETVDREYAGNWHDATELP